MNQGGQCMIVVKKEDVQKDANGQFKIRRAKDGTEYLCIKSQNHYLKEIKENMKYMLQNSETFKGKEVDLDKMKYANVYLYVPKETLVDKYPDGKTVAFKIDTFKDGIIPTVSVDMGPKEPATQEGTKASHMFLNLKNVYASKIYSGMNLEGKQVLVSDKLIKDTKGDSCVLSFHNGKNWCTAFVSKNDIEDSKFTGAKNVKLYPNRQYKVSESIHHPNGEKEYINHQYRGEYITKLVNESKDKYKSQKKDHDITR